SRPHSTDGAARSGRHGPVLRLRTDVHGTPVASGRGVGGSELLVQDGVDVSVRRRAGAARGDADQPGRHGLVRLAQRRPPLGGHAAASGEGFTPGRQGVARVAFAKAGWPVGLRVDGTYGTNGANDRLKADLTTSVGQPSDEETKLVGANVDLTYPVGSTSRVRPYVLGGIGAYHTTISVTSGGSTASSSET